MKTIVTTGLVLARTNYQEADRIVTLLTPDHGKVRVIAKGVRKSKSKMAGGIELFSVGDITYIPGKRDLHTLISTRLKTHYGDIVKDINRTMFGYELLKQINKITEEVVEREYFDLIVSALEGLDNADVPLELTELWFDMQLLKLTGHMPNLTTDKSGHKLEINKSYVFSFDDMAFAEREQGSSDAKLIKFLRLSSAASQPSILSKVEGSEKVSVEALQLVRSMAKLYLYN